MSAALIYIYIYINIYIYLYIYIYTKNIYTEWYQGHKNDI